jgi:tyrosinase
LADYTGFQDQAGTFPASVNNTMPILELGKTKPIVKNYMDTQAGPLCYTYSSM